MNEYMRQMDTSEETEIKNSPLIKLLTVLGIIFFFGVVFQEVQTTYVQAGGEAQYMVAAKGRATP